MVSEISERYALALLELAEEENQLEEYKKEVEVLLGIFHENKQLKSLFCAVKMNKEDKKNFIDQTFQKVCNTNITNFLKVMVDKGRSSYIEESLESFIQQADEKLGIMHASVVSARKLSEEDFNKIQKSLENKTKKTIILENVIDPSVISGIKVIYDNKVIDMTMASKIQNMKDEILKGAQV